MNLRLLRQALERSSGLTVRNWVLLDRVDSTNDLALRFVRSCLDSGYPPPRTLVIALHQVAGRGRLGRCWIGRHGQGAYLSLILPQLGPEELASLPLLVGVGLCHKITAISGRLCGLKWPNDLVVSGRKVGGILIDCVSRQSGTSSAVIGIGVNYDKSEALTTAGGIALSELSGQLPCLSEVIAGLVSAVEEELTHLGDMAYAVACYRESSVHRKGDALQFRTDDGLQSGVFTRLDEKGYLILQTATGEVKLGAGEVIEERARRE